MPKYTKANPWFQDPTAMVRGFMVQLGSNKPGIATIAVADYLIVVTELKGKKEGEVVLVAAPLGPMRKVGEEAEKFFTEIHEPMDDIDPGSVVKQPFEVVVAAEVACLITVAFDDGTVKKYVATEESILPYIG